MSILRDVQKTVPNCVYHVDVGVKRLKKVIEQYDLNLDPEYQRSYIWTNIQKKKFVGSLLENPKLIPPFWINWTNKKFKRDSTEIVDGKQRINAILEWLDGNFIAVCPCERQIHISELDEVDLRGLSTSITLSWNFVELNEIEVMEFYLRLNCGGTIHSEKEIEHVRQLIQERRKSWTK